MNINVALLGAGRIGRVHAEAIRAVSGATLYSVSDAVEEAAKSLADELGCKTVSADEAIAASEVDAVLIATPTDTHADLIEACARAGKAIFCEKPIDLDSERVKACLAVVEETNARLMVGFNRRFDPHFAALKAAIESGAIGQVEQVQITSRDPEPPPAEYAARSGGIFRDMMIHDLDMARFLLGEEVNSLFAVGSVLVDKAIGEAGDVDTAMVILTTESGKQCVITNSRRATYGYDQRIEVHGSEGMVSADNPRLNSVEVAAAQGYSRGPLHNFFMTRYTEAYVSEINRFVEWLSGGDVDVPDGDDGLKALQLADAAVASLASGKTENL
jgi:myo-inositol 2-dehydrogenase/D-chiro-inositol 1-dehydrogenase